MLTELIVGAELDWEMLPYPASSASSQFQELLRECMGPAGVSVELLHDGSELSQEVGEVLAVLGGDLIAAVFKIAEGGGGSAGGKDLVAVPGVMVGEVIKAGRFPISVIKSLLRAGREGAKELRLPASSASVAATGWSPSPRSLDG